MTKQSITVMKQGFKTVKKTLVQKCILTLAIALMVFAGADLNARTIDFGVQEMEMKLTQSAIIVDLETAVPDGFVAVVMNTAFVASFPNASLSADLSAEGTQLAVGVFNGPKAGVHTVGRVDIFDENDALVATAFVKLNDGIVEVELTDF